MSASAARTAASDASSITTPSAIMQTSPGSVARAPAPGVARASAPPMWRNCSIVTVGPRPEPGPTFAISSSIVSAGSASSSWCVRWNGSGSSGSMARSLSTTGGTIANVSRSGPRSRSGHRRSRPSASLPRKAAITTANERPRANAGTSGIGGKWITDAHDMSSSGSEGSSALQVCSTSDARSNGKNIAPA